MSAPRQRPDRTYLLVGLLGVLLVTLATLQYRWIEQLSEADAERRRVALGVAAERFGEDLDRELTRAYLYFLPAMHHAESDLGARLAARRRLWIESAPYPELLAGIYRVTPVPDGPDLGQLGPQGEFETVPWPAALTALREHLARGRQGVSSFGSGGPPVVLPDAPALLLWGGPSSDGERPRDLVVLLLDAGFLEDDLLPQLVARHFGDVGGDYELTVRRVSDDHEVFHSGATVAAVTVEDGMSWPLFQVRPFPDLFALDPGVERGPGVAAEWLRRQRGRPVAPRHWHPGSGHRGDAGWRLEVRFRAGSLEAAVARSRRRNLAVSLGVLGLLAASVLLTVLAARRAQRLARQQMELVAGVTHELYTPLAALRSAGQNLADGVVREPEQVRRYGSLVEEEGRRLSTMVQRMLDLAGLGSGQRVLAREPVAVAPLVEAAVAECRQLLAARGVEAEIDLAPDLPPLLGDREALRRALVNLIENAAQHAAGGGWVGVRGRLGRGGRRVQLVVEDRGPGLDGEDLPHLFDPFYRGRRVSSQIHGSGLGLSLVQRIVRAHGGRVTAGPGHGGTGAAFTLELPVAETSS